MSDTTRRERVDVDHRVLQTPVEDAHANRDDHPQTRASATTRRSGLLRPPIGAGSKRSRTTAQNDDGVTSASTPDRHVVASTTLTCRLDSNNGSVCRRGLAHRTGALARSQADSVLDTSAAPLSRHHSADVADSPWAHLAFEENGRRLGTRKSVGYSPAIVRQLVERLLDLCRRFVDHDKPVLVRWHSAVSHVTHTPQPAMKTASTTRSDALEQRRPVTSTTTVLEAGRPFTLSPLALRMGACNASDRGATAAPERHVVRSGVTASPLAGDLGRVGLTGRPPCVSPSPLADGLRRISQHRRRASMSW